MRFQPPAATHPRPPRGASRDAPATSTGVPRFLGSSRAGDAAEREAGALGAALSQGAKVQVGPAAAALGTEAVAAPALSGGEALPTGLRGEFERGLGADLGAVRIHAGASAAAAAHGAEARAYTVGNDIVFGAGRYQPAQPEGRQLLAHELVHTAQQARSGGAPLLMRAGLADEPEATRETLRFDTEKNTADPKAFFDLQGAPVLASNVSDSFDFTTPSIDNLAAGKGKDAEQDKKTDAKIAVLRNGLKSYARGIFNLIPDKATGKAATARLNLVHVENLDLGRWGGPSTAFRFSCIGSTAKNGDVTARILIEELGAPLAPMAVDTAKDTEDNKKADAANLGAADPLATDPPPRSDVVGERIAKVKATPHGIVRGKTLTSDALWKRFLHSLDRISDNLLQSLHDISVEANSAPAGPDGEPAAFTDQFAAGKWTRSITLYANMSSADDAQFAWLVAHELAHAVDFTPSEGAAGRSTKPGALHDDAAFKAAAKKDGGTANSPTAYGKTADKEFFAECMALYVQHPEELKLLRPNVYAWFVAKDVAAGTAAPVPKTP